MHKQNPNSLELVFVSHNGATEEHRTHENKKLEDFSSS